MLPPVHLCLHLTGERVNGYYLHDYISCALHLIKWLVTQICKFFFFYEHLYKIFLLWKVYPQIPWSMVIRCYSFQSYILLETRRVTAKGSRKKNKLTFFNGHNEQKCKFFLHCSSVPIFFIFFFIIFQAFLPLHKTYIS